MSSISSIHIYIHIHIKPTCVTPISRRSSMIRLGRFFTSTPLQTTIRHTSRHTSYQWTVKSSDIGQTNHQGKVSIPRVLTTWSIQLAIYQSINLQSINIPIINLSISRPTCCWRASSAAPWYAHRSPPRCTSSSWSTIRIHFPRIQTKNFDQYANKTKIRSWGGYLISASVYE